MSVLLACLFEEKSCFLRHIVPVALLVVRHSNSCANRSVGAEHQLAGHLATVPRGFPGAAQKNLFLVMNLKILKLCLSTEALISRPSKA